MIHPEAKFLSSCEPGKPGKLTASKILWWDKHRLDTTVQKGKNRDERRRKSPKQVQNLERWFSLALSLENNPPWLYAPPLGTTEVAASPPTALSLLLSERVLLMWCLGGHPGLQWKQKELVLAPKPVVRVPAMIISESPLVSLLHFLDGWASTFITKELHYPVLESCRLRSPVICS